MSSHDEYSSDEEEVFANKTDVFLGFTDVPFAEEDETPTIEDTFIGGQPVWLHPDSTPLEKQLQCDYCGKPMALLLQAFAPIDGKLYDRVIYIFACKNTAQCSRQKGSVKAFRGVGKNPKRVAEIKAEQVAEAQKILDEKLRLENKRQIQIEMTKDLFDATKPSSNPFGDNPFANPFSNPFQKEEEKKENKKEEEVKKEVKEKKDEKKDEKKEEKLTYAQAGKSAPKPKKSNAPVLPEYPGFFVYTEQEKFKKITLEPELEKYKHLIDKMDTEESKETESSKECTGSSSSTMLTPQNQKISNMLNDAHFENFSNVVGHNSSQVLRYDLGGSPLLYSGRDDVARTFRAGLPDPSYNPSSQRQFELQLMPKAIIDLEEYEDKSVAEILNGMSWGTIIVATDVEDYMPVLDENYVGYVQEYCGVQWEEST